MANPPQPSHGYSGTLIPTQPDGPTPRPEKISIPPPFPSPIAARFPPPRLHQEQTPSPSTRTPNLLSPANGVKTGSPIPHLSTPPGPPVFSSPLRPAAVPFRTSPATPQPVAISSSSSLPTSSPPYYSNGSAELQHQVSDATDESFHLEKSPYVLFSADKVSLFPFLFRSGRIFTFNIIYIIIDTWYILLILKFQLLREYILIMFLLQHYVLLFPSINPLILIMLSITSV